MFGRNIESSNDIQLVRITLQVLIMLLYASRDTEQWIKWTNVNTKVLLT